MDKPAVTNLEELKHALRIFSKERNWDQYHSPKNLAAALMVEAAELLEHFQWITQKQSAGLTAEKRKMVSYEMADVLIYLTRMADRLDIDLLQAASEKILLNQRKYPVEDRECNTHDSP